MNDLEKQLEPLLERWSAIEPTAVLKMPAYGAAWSVALITGGHTPLTIGSPQTPLKLRHAIITSAARHGIRLEPTLPLAELLNGLLEQLPVASGCRLATAQELEAARTNYGGDDVQFYDNTLASTDSSGVWVRGWVWIAAAK